jgi:hypothetical protein
VIARQSLRASVRICEHKQHMSNFPLEVYVATSSRPTRYTLAEDYFVVSGEDVGDADLSVEFHIEDGDLMVCRMPTEPTSLATFSSPAGPVYRLKEHGSLAIPTGRVFVRFSEHTKFENHRMDIKRYGFKVDQILSYAPHAGWVKPNSGEIAEALSRFEELKQIPGVAAVEPQMIMQSQQR